MNRTLNEKLLMIIKTYGIKNQLKYFQSEIFELNEAIIQNEYPFLNNDNKPKEIKEFEKKHITEEIADVLVMLEQFRIYYDIQDMDIKDVMVKKIERQIERIKNEENKENE